MSRRSSLAPTDDEVYSFLSAGDGILPPPPSTTNSRSHSRSITPENDHSTSSKHSQDHEQHRVPSVHAVLEMVAEVDDRAIKWASKETQGLSRSELQSFLARLVALVALGMLLLLCLVQVNLHIQNQEQASNVTVVDRQLFVNGQPYFVRGVNYNPIPRGEDGQAYPYGDYYTPEYATGLLNHETLLSSFYTDGSLWEGLWNRFRGHHSYHEPHLREISKTFNTICVYSWNLDQRHWDFLDLCHKYGLMVIVTFWMDRNLYPDLTNDDTVEACMANFRHVLRQNKGHPAVLMWAVGLEPNDPGRTSSYSRDLGMYFDFIENLRQVRDDEETTANYYPHPLLVPLADFDFMRIVRDYNTAQHDVWGVQPYRGDTFGDLFRDFISEKPLLVSEYGMDAYNDVILNDEQLDCLNLDPALQTTGENYQAVAITSLATEVESQNSGAVHHIFLAATLHRGTTLDTTGGYAVLEYNNLSQILHYSLAHQSLSRFSIGNGLVNDTAPDAPASRFGTQRLESVPLEPSATSDPSAVCATASGLSLCSEWNGRQIGTCYNVEDIDGLAQQMMDNFGGECARAWACAAIATCYFSANPKHWCAFTNASVCYAAFHDCGQTHVQTPDFPPSLAYTTETPVAPDSFVDPDSPSGSTVSLSGVSMSLTFSDEFNVDGRTFGWGHSAKWEAADYHEAGDAQCYRPEMVTTTNGAARFAFEANTTFDRGQTGFAYRSARLQSWNKVCFTGGYLEARVKLPGTAMAPGLKAAFSVLGNLGRLGYPASLQGLWPWSYSTCDTVASAGQADWSNSDIGPQNFSACDTYQDAYGWTPYQGRGVPQVDVFVSEVPAVDATRGRPWNGERGAHVVTGLTVGPKIPPNTTHGGGSTGNCTDTYASCTGISLLSEYRHDTGMNRFCMAPDGQLADTAHDCVAADVNVYPTHFDTYHRYGLHVEPGYWMKWYIDDKLVFELHEEGLTSKTNPDNTTQTVAQRLIPREPLYFALGLSSADLSAVTLPAELAVDYVRLFQGSGHTFGCDPSGYGTAAYVAAHQATLGVSTCGDGACDAGECEQCPEDCREIIACRRDCVVPQCQTRDPSFLNPTAHWAFEVREATIRASVAWNEGTAGVRINITHSGWLTYDLVLVQNHVLLCQAFRYRITLVASAPTGNGTITARVLQATSDLVNFTASLNGSMATYTREFLADSRHSDAVLSLELGLNNHDTLIDVESVTLCPVPSAAQSCYSAPRQTPQTLVEALEGGNTRAEAFSADGATQAYGTTWRREGLPSFKAALAMDTDQRQTTATDFIGEAYFWPTDSTATDGAWAVEWLVVHSSPWFAPDRMVQAIALHWEALLPSPGNLILPVYCNADVPLPSATSPVNCSLYETSTVADVYGSGQNFSRGTFKAVRTIDPRSTDFELLNPLSGTFTLTTAEYEIFQSESSYVIMYMQDDDGPYGRIRGKIDPHHQPSCVGGVIFEYSDEWWKGSKGDTWHTGCSKDGYNEHSTCGKSQVGFGPDERLNEEWFGLYNTTYEDGKDHVLSLTPRSSVSRLQMLWNRTDAGATAAAPSARMAASLRTAATGDPAVYEAVFPQSIGDFNEWDWLLFCAFVLALAMVGLLLFSMSWPYVYQSLSLAAGLLDAAEVPEAATGHRSGHRHHQLRGALGG